ncbi:MAG TPA: J domain-containing protein [Thermoanaerobaculia bacterium]|nr:J domain-containing protein [Thermoanaerobaculia bacterium]
METIAVIFMIIAGFVVAALVTAALAIAHAGKPAPLPSSPPDKSSIAASILFQLLILGGTNPDQAARKILREAGLGAPITRDIDIGNWGETFAGMATIEQRSLLLETAVRLACSFSRTLPLVQYTALLSLSFALGFQTDALARLRERYDFDYIDPARDGRPREADRDGSAPLFVREPRSSAELLRVLGIEGTPSRQSIIAAYRRLASEHHPDRYFGQTAEAQRRAATRFIEITRAYESLLSLYRE